MMLAAVGGHLVVVQALLGAGANVALQEKVRWWTRGKRRGVEEDCEERLPGG